MLDTATKRRIDTARDILVGKVPDPKSQVEQITIALIYKFMDDIDAMSEELGGQRKYFSGDFARYGWPRLVRSGLGGHETLNLYAEAITRMPENPAIPSLFRNIFNNAYLPYRDPETLRAFLKIIDEFNYDHSERLGDAFEYLLSVLGSQGDAGQFRTPRHIIDFMVAIIDPKKDETVLDPACGTAGFLISAYKHILEANRGSQGGQDNEGNPVSGLSRLTPDEKGKLATNFTGYDISPDMVRLSLVNLYLHGFVAPQIHEYDTLTSEERWNEYADVILANPPFMSPKGGIRPHSRFSVQSKRSEVLFVDYMAEHLTPRGRAGIIVPEGIIFQSQNAHRQLRKMLVENYLVAVISLPAGVFKPYSGVKTSILVLDRALARRSNRIAFFKVENDGFDLGDQRRAIAKNDLPKVKAEITEYLRRLRAGEPVGGSEPAPTGQVSEPEADYTSTLGLIAGKEKIAEDGEYNLSGERYRERRTDNTKYEWPITKLEDICDDILSGGTPSTKNEEYWKGDIPWITSADIVNIKTAKPRKHITKEAIKKSATNLIPKGNLIVVTRVGLGKLFRNNFDVCISQDSQGLIVKDIVNSKYLVYVLKDKVLNFKKISQGSTIQGVTKSQLAEIEIPLPPLEVQQEIVAEIEGYQRVIDGARAVIDSYRPQIVIDPEWPMVELGECCEINPETVNPILAYPDGTILYVDISSVENETGRFLGYNEIESSEAPSRARRGIREGDVLLSTVRPNLKAFALFKEVRYNAVASTGFAVLRARRSIADPVFLLVSVRSDYAVSQMVAMMGKGAYPSINQQDVASIKIALPPLEVQQSIVAEIETEQALVAANRELIERFEKKIQSAVERVWGKGEVGTVRD